LVGKPVGIVANQPKVKAGCLDIDASTKIAKFVQLCDCFNIPIINLVDVPGYLPGIDQEHGGIIRHGAKLLYAYGRAGVPKISVILRKAYGGAYIAMASKGLGYDIVLAWPEAEIGVMGAEQALNLFQAEKMVELGEKDLQQKIKQYKLENINIYKVAATDKVDQLIARSDTRKTLVSILQALKNKTYVPTGKRHGNIPL
jgi:propionyl-CoA carboxylase beta chain